MVGACFSKNSLFVAGTDLFEVDIMQELMRRVAGEQSLGVESSRNVTTAVYRISTEDLGRNRSCRFSRN